MLRFLRVAALLLSVSLLLIAPAGTYGQSATKNSSAPAAGEAQRALSLAESGHCTQALPLLKKVIRQVTDKDLKKRVGLHGVHCAMTHAVRYEARDVVAVLTRDCPRAT